MMARNATLLSNYLNPLHRAQYIFMLARHTLTIKLAFSTPRAACTITRCNSSFRGGSVLLAWLVSSMLTLACYDVLDVTHFVLLVLHQYLLRRQLSW